MVTGNLTISIDLELAWGNWDNLNPYHIDHVERLDRIITSRLNECFDRHEVPVTWAFVAALLDPESARGRLGSERLWYAPDVIETINNASVKHDLGSHGGHHKMFDKLAINEADDGKGQELDAFLTHIRSRPSIALSQAFLQGRVQKSQEADEMATEARNALDILSRAKGVTIGQMLVAVERTAMAKGEALGRFEELLLLIQNYGAYSADFAAANQLDRDSRARWAAALGAAGRSLASRPTVSVSCTRFGNMVNCTGQ